MNQVMMRIQCLRMSSQIKTKFGLKTTQEEIAEALAVFAIEGGDAGIEPRMASLDIALSDADRRAGLADVLNDARSIMEFALPKPKPVPSPEPKPVRVRKQRRKVKTSR